MNNEIHMRVTMSEFPDELLLKILSFLSSKDVVATSAMSKRSGSSIESLPLKLNQYFLSVLINPLVDDLVARSLRELRIEMLYNSFEWPESLYFYPHLETLKLEKPSHYKKTGGF
ncbi:hypothetical protein YC2023_075627 [Brassica napus]